MSNARVVASTELANGRLVSTVRLPVTLSGRAFETMVFPSVGVWSDLDCRRYFTIDEAKAGHTEMVAKWSGA